MPFGPEDVAKEMEPRQEQDPKVDDKPVKPVEKPEEKPAKE